MRAGPAIELAGPARLLSTFYYPLSVLSTLCSFYSLFFRTAVSSVPSPAHVDTDHARGARLALAAYAVDQQADVVASADLGDCRLEIRHRVDVVARLGIEHRHDDVVGHELVV